MELDKDLYNEIKAYCDLNKLKARDFIHNLLREAFMKEKYGDRPFATVIPETKVEPVKEEKHEAGVLLVPPTAETITNYTSTATTLYEVEEVPKELYENIKVEPQTTVKKTTKRKL